MTRVVRLAFAIAIAIAIAAASGRGGAQNPPPRTPPSQAGVSPRPGLVRGWELDLRLHSTTEGGSETSTRAHVFGAGTKVRMETETTFGNSPAQRWTTLRDEADPWNEVIIHPDAGGAQRRHMAAIVDGRWPEFAVDTWRADSVDPGEGAAIGRLIRRYRIAGTRHESLGAVTCARPFLQSIDVVPARDTMIRRVTAMLPRRSLSTFGPPLRNLLERLDMLAATGSGASGVWFNFSDTIPAAPARGMREVVVYQIAAIADARVTDVDPALFELPAAYPVQDLRLAQERDSLQSKIRAAEAAGFWTRFDTTAAAGPSRATCRPR